MSKSGLDFRRQQCPDPGHLVEIFTDFPNGPSDAAANSILLDEKAESESNRWSRPPARASCEDLRKLANRGAYLTLIFAEADHIRPCPACKAIFTHVLRIPPVWWKLWMRNSNGHFGCEETFGSDTGEVDGYNPTSIDKFTDTWFRYLVKKTQQEAPGGRIDFTWLKFNVFTRWEAATNHTFLVVFDPKPPVRQGILSSISTALRFTGTPSSNASGRPEVRGDTEGRVSDWVDPFWVHVELLEPITASQDAAVWGVRELVRAVELSRSSDTAAMATTTISGPSPAFSLSGPDPDYAQHHEIARHTIHVSETTALSIKTTEHMLAAHRDFLDYHFHPHQQQEQHNHQPTHSTLTPDPSSTPKATPHHPIITTRTIHSRLRFYEHAMHSLHLRASATRDRLSNEIQLAFNVVSQHDSRASVVIGRAAQYDSYSMRSVAFFTMTFLPATFVSAIFSMSFFSYDPAGGGWTVSGEIWLYFAIAGPVTVLALGVWVVWQRLFPLEKVVAMAVPAAAVAPRRNLMGFHQASSPSSGAGAGMVVGGGSGVGDSASGVVANMITDRGGRQKSRVSTWESVGSGFQRAERTTSNTELV